MLSFHSPYEFFQECGYPPSLFIIHLFKSADDVPHADGGLALGVDQEKGFLSKNSLPHRLVLINIPQIIDFEIEKLTGYADYPLRYLLSLSNRLEMDTKWTQELKIA